MSLDLKTRVALLIHFNDSIGESYAYFNRDYVQYNHNVSPIGKEILWDKIEEDKYHLEIDEDYFDVAEEIISIVKNAPEVK